MFIIGDSYLLLFIASHPKIAYLAKVGQSDLLNDYFNFLTNINGVMKFYEREVYSIPTGKRSNDAVNELKIYECPNNGKYIIKQKPLYLTFRRHGGGEMDRLYRVEDIIIINFKDEFQLFMENEGYPLRTRKAVDAYVNYIRERTDWGEKLPGDEKQIFILADKTIELIHRPKPRRNNSFRAYYSLADLLDPNQVTVETE